MHAWSARSEIQRNAPTCLCFQLFSEHCSKLHKTSNSPWGPVGGLPTSCWEGRLPVDHFSWLKTRKSGRPARFTGWPTSCCCQTPLCCNREQERALQCICKICVHNHPPYYVMSSREYGSRPSGHQSRISMHDRREAKLHNSIWNECTHKHIKPRTLSCMIERVGNQELRHVSSLQVWNVPRFSRLDYHLIQTNAMQLKHANMQSNSSMQTCNTIEQACKQHARDKYATTCKGIWSNYQC